MSATKTGPRKRHVVIVEYDVSDLTAAQVDALLLRALVGDQNVSFKIEVQEVLATSCDFVA